MTAPPSRPSAAPPLAEAVVRAVAHLIPSARCTVTASDEPQVAGMAQGCTPHEGEVVCWGRIAGDGWSARIRRESVALTEAELALLTLLPDAVTDVGGIDPGLGGSLSSGDVLEEALITRLLHRRAGGAVPSRAITTVLGALRQLSLCRYEGRPATSGVLVVADPAGWVEAVVAHPAVVTEAFSVPLRMDHTFFDQPASHRYVDGHRCLYLVGPDLAVHGLVRLPQARYLDPQDIAMGVHVEPLLAAGVPGWVATVDAGSTVNVIGVGGLHLRWRSYHWRLLDPGLLPARFEAVGLSADDARTLAGSLTALSDAHLGTLVLIPTARRTPRIAGVIDSSPRGAALLTHLVGRTVGQLRADGSLLGILSCDGLSIISAGGELVMTGAIIELQDNAGGGSGGGRTHAAISAALAGLTAMVSSDGQITLYEDGRVVLQMER